jgi:hypothetical protein
LTGGDLEQASFGQGLEVAGEGGAALGGQPGDPLFEVVQSYSC